MSLESRSLEHQICERLHCRVTRVVRSLTCGIGIAALHILERAAAVDDEVFCPSAEMYKV